MPDPVRKSAFVVAIASLFLPVTVPIARAQAPGSLIYTVVVPAGDFGSAAYTSVVVGGLSSAGKFCSELGNDAYRVDCLAERYGALARAVPRNSDYGEVREVLKSASEDLASLARNNRDRTLARGRATGPGSSQTTSRPLTPVDSAAMAKVNRQARAILAQTETLLLRSAEGSKSKIAQYAQIADAIGSNKVLLRAT